jgi:hypothetical protein
MLDPCCTTVIPAPVNQLPITTGDKTYFSPCYLCRTTVCQGHTHTFSAVATQGWQCPLCRKVWAPHVRCCEACMQQAISAAPPG